jgi:hypothetical protein
MKANSGSDNTGVHADIYALATHAPHADTAEPTRSPELPRIGCLAGGTAVDYGGRAHQPREQ